ncbi:MAG TPA: hypothetical protein VH440_04745 [Candidatus Limnocylindrales bacterium]|jgi:4-amino-4-deoxy-L-arabinose transferase-like glycosyltransferase
MSLQTGLDLIVVAFVGGVAVLAFGLLFAGGSRRRRSISLGLILVIGSIASFWWLWINSFQDRT